MYFLMILAYAELVRRGLWAAFKFEDDHSLNIGNLRALLDDTPIYKELTAKYAIEEKPFVT